LDEKAVKFAYLSVSKYFRGEIMSATREHIIRLADSLIRQRGFNAFSYADIAMVLDIRKAAIHYYFPTKSLLGQAVIEEELLRLKDYRRLHAGLGGDLQLKHLVGIFYHNSQRNAVCLIGALTPELATFDEGMQSMLRDLCVAIREWMEDCLQEARTAGRFRFSGSAADRAALVVSTLLSSLLLARTEAIAAGSGTAWTGRGTIGSVGGAKAEGAGLFQRMLDQLLEDLGARWRVGDLPALVPVGEEGPYSFT
jgi:TetR/AcrR family transcriptional repressor of nem operon